MISYQFINDGLTVLVAFKTKDIDMIHKQLVLANCTEIEFVPHPGTPVAVAYASYDKDRHISPTSFRFKVVQALDYLID